MRGGATAREITMEPTPMKSIDEGTKLARKEAIGSSKLATGAGGSTMGSPPKERGALVMKAKERANESGASSMIGLVKTSRSGAYTPPSSGAAASAVFAAATELAAGLTSCTPSAFGCFLCCCF